MPRLVRLSLRKPARPALRLSLPSARRRWWPAIIASLLIHVLLFVVWRTEPWWPGVAGTPAVIALPPLESELRPGAPAPYYSSRERRSAGRRPPPQTPVTFEPGELQPPLEVPKLLPVDTTVPHAFGPVPRIGPGLANGRLWVQPLPLPPRELAQKLQRTNAELADSIVTATVQAYLDSIAREPGADRTTLPSWTKEIAGAKFGLDSKYIYLGGIRIPAALLALIPLPGANESKAFDRSQQLLEDLRQAARRAATTADFKEEIKQLRERKQQERDFLRAQQAEPDTLRPDSLRKE